MHAIMKKCQHEAITLKGNIELGNCGNEVMKKGLYNDNGAIKLNETIEFGNCGNEVIMVME